VAAVARDVVKEPSAAAVASSDAAVSPDWPTPQRRTVKDTVFGWETSVWRPRRPLCRWRSDAKGARLVFEGDTSSRRFVVGDGLASTSSAASCARRRMAAGEVVAGRVVDGEKRRRAQSSTPSFRRNSRVRAQSRSHSKPMAVVHELKMHSAWASNLSPQASCTIFGCASQASAKPASAWTSMHDVTSSDRLTSSSVPDAFQRSSSPMSVGSWSASSIAASSSGYRSR